MRSLVNRWRKKKDEGQGMVEYGLIIALVSIVAVIALTALGGKVTDKFEDVNAALDSFEDVNATDIPPAGDTLENYTWEEISLISDSGLASTYFGVGDEKTVTINGQDYVFQIYGFDHDDLADGSGKAGITFGMKGLFASTQQMNTSNTNTYGWNGSLMRAYLNGISTTKGGSTYATSGSVYSQLPSELQSLIKPVYKHTSNTSPSFALTTSTDKLFLFSDEEVALGNFTYSTAGEGSAYDIFSDNASRIKRAGSSAFWWWLRSSYTNLSNYFLGVNYDGNLTDNGAGSSGYFAFGFCI